MDSEIEEDAFYSLRAAESYSRVTAQALYKAIQKGDLKATKVIAPALDGFKRALWKIEKKDIDDYRANKYIREKKRIDGELIFDVTKGNYSILHVAKFLQSELRRPYHTSKIYYHLRRGDIRGQKRGSAWVLDAEAVAKLLEMAQGMVDRRQMRFA